MCRPRAGVGILIGAAWGNNINKYMAKKITIIFIILAVFCLGLLAGMILKQNLKTVVEKCNCDYVKEMIVDSGACEIADNDFPIKSLSGSIVNKNNDSFQLKVDKLDIWTEEEFRNRIIVIDNNTKIYKKILKNQDEHEKELQEHEKTRDQYENEDEYMLNAPNAFEYKDYSFLDLEVNSMVIVRSDSNIRQKKQFIAKEILLK